MIKIIGNGSGSGLSLQKIPLMKKNMGVNDRVLRTVIAVAVAALYFTGTLSGTLGLVLLILAIVFLLTSIVSFCPLYTLIGVNTCKRE